MGFSVMLATATVSGATDAIVLGRIRGSGSLAVTATGQNRASADAVLVAISILGGGAGLVLKATITPTARTFAQLHSPETVLSTGDVLVSARTRVDAGLGAQASATADAGGGGVIAGAGYTTDAKSQAPVTAELRGDVIAGG